MVSVIRQHSSRHAFAPEECCTTVLTGRIGDICDCDYLFNLMQPQTRNEDVLVSSEYPETLISHAPRLFTFNGFVSITDSDWQLLCTPPVLHSCDGLYRTCILIKVRSKP